MTVGGDGFVAKAKFSGQLIPLIIALFPGAKHHAWQDFEQEGESEKSLLNHSSV